MKLPAFIIATLFANASEGKRVGDNLSERLEAFGKQLREVQDAHKETNQELVETKERLKEIEYALKLSQDSEKETMMKLKHAFDTNEDNEALFSNSLKDIIPFFPSRDLCYQDELNIGVGAFIDDVDAKKVIYDLSEQHVEKGESLLVEVTVSTALVRYLCLANDDYCFDRRKLQYAQFSDSGVVLRVLLNGAITPKPASKITLAYAQQEGEIDSESLLYYEKFEVDASTDTAKFFFPNLPKGYYTVQLEIYIVTRSFASDFDSSASVTGVLLGPHIVEVNKFKAESSSVCFVKDIIDDDNVAEGGFDDFFPDIYIDDFVFGGGKASITNVTDANKPDGNKTKGSKYLRDQN